VRKSINEVVNASQVGITGSEQIRAHRFDESSQKAMPYSRRDYYKIWIVRAPGAIHYATYSVNIDRPALIFSNPRVPYAYEAASQHLGPGYLCIFTEDFLHETNRPISLQESPLFKPGARAVFFPDEQQLAFIGSLFDKIIEELQSSYVYRHDVLRSYVNLIIHEGLKLEPTLRTIAPHNASSRIASLFLELLERQFPIESTQHALSLRKAGDYANSLSVHVNHLNHAVRSVTGKSTSAHIAERITTEAKAMLKHTDLSIADVAYCLGFEYPNYFNNFFKKNTGTTPLAYRR
jgi:AraC family transcriptional regulator, transcriptional activator of pobA